MALFYDRLTDIFILSFYIDAAVSALFSIPAFAAKALFVGILAVSCEIDLQGRRRN